MSASRRVLPGQRNIAPSAAHASHDVYGVELAPDEPAEAFCFGPSSGGGQAERGSEICLARGELEPWRGDWRRHLDQAGCASLRPLLERGLDSGDAAATLGVLPAAARPAKDGAA